MISKYDVVGGGKFSKWQLDLRGKVRGKSARDFCSTSGQLLGVRSTVS